MADRASSANSRTLPRRRISLRERLSGSLRGSFPSFRRRSTGDEPRLVQWIHEDQVLQQDTVRYTVKYLGFRETQQPKGSDAIIQVIGDLKGGRTPRAKTGMSWLSLVISQESLRLIDESTPDEPILIFEFATHRVSSVSEYKHDDVYLGMIIRHGALGQHKVHVFETDHESQQVALTLAQAFHLAFSRYMQLHAEEEGMVVDGAAAVYNETSAPARDIDRTGELAPNLNEQYNARTSNSERPRLSMKWLTEARDCSLSENDQHIPLVRSAEDMAGEEPAELQESVFSPEQRSPEGEHIVAGSGTQDAARAGEEGIDDDDDGPESEHEESGGGDTRPANAEETHVLINRSNTPPEDTPPEQSLPSLDPESEDPATEVPVSLDPESKDYATEDPVNNVLAQEEDGEVDNAEESDGDMENKEQVQVLQRTAIVQEAGSSPPSPPSPERSLDIESKDGHKVQDESVPLASEDAADLEDNMPPLTGSTSAIPIPPHVDDQPRSRQTSEQDGEDGDDFTGNNTGSDLVLPRGDDDDPPEGVADWHASNQIGTQSHEKENSAANDDARTSTLKCLDEQGSAIFSGDEGIDLDDETEASGSLGDCDAVSDHQDEANILTPTEDEDAPGTIGSVDPCTGQLSDEEDQMP